MVVISNSEITIFQLGALKMLWPVIFLFLTEIIGKGDLSENSTIRAAPSIVGGEPAIRHANPTIKPTSRIVEGEPASRSTPYAGSAIEVAPRIVGGQESIPHAAPYAVYVQSIKPVKQMSVCTGSLISRNWVITARHCYEEVNTKMEAWLGTHNHRIREPTQIRKVLDMSKMIRHPESDIMLLKLPEPVKKLNRYVKIIKLPSLADENKTYDYQVARASGWGVSTDAVPKSAAELRTIRLLIIPRKECKEIIGDRNLTEKEMCTQGNMGKGACSGDSGGPLVINDVLVGATSRGQPECEKGDPTIWTSLNHFLPWLKENTDADIH